MVDILQSSSCEQIMYMTRVNIRRSGETGIASSSKLYICNKNILSFFVHDMLTQA